VADVLFGQSYYLRFDPKLWAAMQPYPPLGTLYAAAVARARGYSVALFDAMLAASEDEWDAALRSTSPRFAVLFEDSFNYLSKMCLLRMREAALRMLAMARARGVPAVVCGSDASDHPALYLDAGAAAVIAGEGEAPLVELLDRLSGRTSGPIEAIAGTVSRDARGALQAGPKRPVLKDLDALPFPAWDLVDAERYRSLWRHRHGYTSVNMATTRGCPYHCNWCAKPIWGQTYNSRSPENVVAELQALRATFRPDHIAFADDIFGLQPGWVGRYADAVVASGARTPFKCLSRADLLLRKGEIEALARAGAQTVWVGAESGSQRILDAMEKGTRVEQIREAAARLRAAGIRVGFFLQFGYPGETREDIAKTEALVRSAAPDEIGMSVSYPLPGTSFYERVKADLGTRRNWVDSDDLAMLYRGPFSTAFYRSLYTVVQKDFRMRDGLREVRRAIAAPASLRGRHLRRLAAASFHAATLPLARLRLERAARVPHDGVGPLAPALTPEAAAMPTPQD
jgi:radical SAM superfamily enzyme YgiQ (UPF0313 family)